MSTHVSGGARANSACGRVRPCHERRSCADGPTTKPLPPRIQATPEQLAQAMFAMPADQKWKYLEGKGIDYRCGRCENPVG